ncbi:uncharacterized protein CCOS01_14245 [Colletotrichum costaricense]|uniref:HNH nuclease domain-containing protein n=1 Tax=Colletotrichum costaricense TaxID=1209916 RepID=A0AAI9YJ88_9PEZI|nr:uncharacterized protein CCOS01_14245 [Colletotrichum costaricense]KAK1513303.1 hypothetical protein CCOS01_14245 [Colletotrichum costaricense]
MSVSEHPELDGALIEERLSTLGDDSVARLGVTVALDTCDAYVPSDPSDDTSHVLKIFLRRLEGNGLTTLAAEVCLYQNEPDNLRALRNHLIDALLKPMLARGRAKGLISQPVDEDTQTEIQSILHEVETVPRDATLRNECLKRDGGKCMVSQYWSDTWEEPSQGKICSTNCAHCIPYSLSTTNGSYIQTVNIATIWLAYHRYFTDLQGAIASESINQLPNVMTLMDTLHKQFRKLKVAFKSTGVQNQYAIQWFGSAERFYLRRILPPTVQFSAHNGDENLPDPAFLRCHYILAEVYNDMNLQNLSLKVLPTLPPDEKMTQNDELSFISGAGDESVEDTAQDMKLELRTSFKG